jgi:hypothetical protein
LSPKKSKTMHDSSGAEALDHLRRVIKGICSGQPSADGDISKQKALSLASILLIWLRLLRLEEQCQAVRLIRSSAASARS